MTIDFGTSRNYLPHCSSWCSSLLRRIKIDQWHSRVKCSGREAPSTVWGPGPVYTCKSHSHMDCAQCSACALERTFGHADDFLVKYKDMLSKRSFELSFTGSFGEANNRRYPNGLTIADEYRFQRALNTRGWSAIELKSFQFNMYWKFWDMMILSSISQGHLLTLKIPFPRFSELEALVRALSVMTRLRSLVVTDIPDKPNFPRYAPMLGQGIRSREASLRELDLEMTNFNRPNAYANEWERDEIFPRRSSLAWFFDNLFLDPEDLDEWRNSQLPYKSQASECVEYALSPTCGQRLLKLEKLRLKNIDVPAYASQKIFDWTYLKELRLPHGRVDDAIWEDLKAAKLEVLEDIDYTELTHSLTRLLQSQSSLKSVTFARPQPLWEETGMVDWEDGNGPQMTFGLVEWPSPLGPGTDWARSGNWNRPAHHTPWYPSITALLVALGKDKGLENLVLPADMFDITPAVIQMTSRQLKSLTHLTWGFDYDDQVSFAPCFHFHYQTELLLTPPGLPNSIHELLSPANAQTLPDNLPISLPPLHSQRRQPPRLRRGKTHQIHQTLW